MSKLLMPVFALLLSVPVQAATRVSVSPLKSSLHGSASCRGNYWGGSLGRGLAEQLTSELQKAGRFELQEEKKAAHYSIEGAVTSFELCSSGGKAAADVGKLMKLGTSLKVGAHTSTARVAIDLRAVDVKTGAVAAAFTSEGKASASGIDFAGKLRGAGFGSSAFYATPLGEATREAVTSAAARFVRELPERTDEAASEAASEPAKTARKQAAAETEFVTGVVCATMQRGRYTACKPLEMNAAGNRIKALNLDTGREMSVPASDVWKLDSFAGKPADNAVAYVSCRDANFCHRTAGAAKLFSRCSVLAANEASATLQCGSKQFDVPLAALNAGTVVDLAKP